MPPKYFTQRLLLNLITEDDHEFILCLLNTEGWLQFIGDRNVHSTEASIEYIKRIKNTPELFYWVVRLKCNQTPIGIISFLKRNYLEYFDLGFAFLPQFTGYGYAFEAAREILSIANKRPEYNPILASTVPENTNSIKLLMKLGFRFEKEMEVNNRKLHIYTN